MQPSRFDIGTDVYRSTTVHGPLPRFDSAWGAFYRACALFRRCLPDLVKVTAPVLLPVAIVVAWIPPLVICLDHSDWRWPLGFVLGLLGVAWSTGAAIHVAWRRVEGRAVDVREARMVGGELASRMLAVRLRYWFKLSVGYFLWFVPGLYWAGQNALAEPVVYFERAASGAAMARSAELTRGSIGRALGTTLLGVLAASLLVFPLTFVASRVVIGARAFGPASMFAVSLLYGLAADLALMFVSVLRLVMYLGVADEPSREAPDRH